MMEEEYDAECDDIHPTKGPKKKSRISVTLLLKRQFGPEALKWDEEKKLNELNKATHIRLDRENLGDTDGLEILGSNITNLYLQHNKIEVIENLEFLPNLRFLTLSQNRIRKIEGLRPLRKLGFLDLSENFISKVDTGELPKSLVIINLSENKCSQLPDYRINMIKALPKLKTLDSVDLVRQEKLDAGYQLSDSEEDIEDEEEEEEEKPAGRNVADMLLASQKRLEQDYKVHRSHLIMLDDIRENSEIPLTTRSSSRSSTMSDRDHIVQKR